MYTYLARDGGPYDKQIYVYVDKPITTKENGDVWYCSNALCRLPILTHDDKPVALLMELDKVKLPGWLCYKSKDEMVFCWIKIHSLYKGGLRSVNIPILKPGQCKRISIK